MEDNLLNFGDLGALSTTAAYCANTLDLGVDEPHIVSGSPCVVRFYALSDCKAFKPTLYSGSTETPTTKVYEHPVTVDLNTGKHIDVQIPLKLSRYLRAGGTATSGSVSARIVMGNAL